MIGVVLYKCIICGSHVKRGRTLLWRDETGVNNLCSGEEEEGG